MADSENHLSALYADLNRLGQKQDWDKALKVADKILSSSPREELAFRCKHISLIQLNKFEEALLSLKRHPTLNKTLVFEKAYCEYRLNRTKDALTTLHSCSQPDLRTKELLAQVLYRLEEFGECNNLYKEVIKNCDDDFDEEREANLSAVLACMKLWQNSDMAEPSLRVDTYELCYNRACFLIGQGDWKRAEQMLDRAAKLCRESMEEEPDVMQEDIEQELAIIRVQLAYLKQCLGHTDEALQLYNLVLKRKPSDVGLVAVASNNVVTLNKEQNVFDSKKKMKAATSEGVNHKLGSHQRTMIAVNHCLLNMYTNQGEQCRRAAARLRTDHPELDTPILIEAAQLLREKQTAKAVDLLTAYSRANRHSVDAKLALAQIYLTQGSVYPACELLNSLGELSHRPGIVSLLVSLYQSEEDAASVTECLTRAIAWYRKHQPKNGDLVLLMRACANHFTKIGSHSDATEMLEQLHALDTKDPRVLAMLITAYTETDPKKAQVISDKLPSVEDIAKRVDVDSLEAGFTAFTAKYKKATRDMTPSSPAAGGGDASARLNKRKRKKKTKLPKNYNPDVPLDPERWLPKQERSYYRGKKRDKRKNADIGRGTQGSAAVDSGDGKQTTRMDTASPLPASSSSPTVGPRAQKPAQAAQKKRKKKGGNKW